MPRHIGDELIEELSKHPPLDPENGQPVEAMLTKFIIVAEWMDADGRRWLSKAAASGHGDTIPTWDQKGLLHEGLFGGW